MTPFQSVEEMTAAVSPIARVVGDSVHLTGVAVCPDGRVWFSSRGPQSGTSDTVAV